MKYLKYLRYVLRHKWFVFLACLQYGEIEMLWRGIMHDMSKLYPSEFIPYAETFYGEKPSPRNSTGTYDPLAVGSDFDFAWLHHQHFNPHHWQYWMLKGDEDALKVLPMPLAYRKEMLADWRGASKAIRGFDDTVNWYANNKDKMILHPDTREWIEWKLEGYDSDY